VAADLRYQLLTSAQDDHEHAGEQSLKRTLAGVNIPVDIDTVTIEGRDLVNGFEGTTFDVDVTGNASS
jgi:hypothetical protein